MVDIEAVRRSLGAQTSQTGELLRSMDDPGIPIPDSEWTVGEAAAHLAIGAEGYSEYARGLTRRHPIDITDVAGSTRRALEAMPERDGDKLAAMLESGVELFLDATAGYGAEDPVRWHSDMMLPCATITSFLLVEQIVHGWDIAGAISAPWTIPPDSARLVIAAVGPFLAFAVDREAAADVQGEYELSIDGGPRFFAACRCGGLTIGTSPTGTVDCRLSGDPVTWLLALWGRLPWAELLADGRITAEGDPTLAARFKSLLRDP
jgi:uncharacterized protein (TIGR03083 family)